MDKEIEEQKTTNSSSGTDMNDILNFLVEKFGWKELSTEVNILCFSQEDPSIESSLEFLNKTPWARAKVERFYLKSNR